MMRAWLRLFVVAAVSSAAAPAVHAQPAAPVPAVTDKTKAKTAKQYVDAGLAAQNTGDYDTAITFYTKAYELVPHPVLIFNIAQATRLAGRIDDALALYAKYLAADPNGSQAQTARDIVAEIQTGRANEARKADDARKAEAARKADEARKAEAAHRADDARKAEPARKASDPPTASGLQVAQASASQPNPDRIQAADSDAPAGPGRTLRLTGIATGAAGAVGLGIGIGFAVHGSSLASDVQKQYDPAKVNAGNRSNTIAAVGIVAGGVLVATGVTLYVWGHAKDRRADGVAIAPLVAPQLAGLVLSGSLP
jgi:tetratricopeptide (TPR) repeat protein